MGKPFDMKITWLRNYAREYANYFDVSNNDLVDRFIEEFHPSKEQSEGANRSRPLGVFLSEAFKKGFLRRGRIGLPGRGGAKWVYGYSLKLSQGC